MTYKGADDMNYIPCALTIAGTDPTGGAGIQADLKTFQELKTYGMSIITTVVSQNTTGVQDVYHMPLSMIESQLKSVIDDMPIHAFKTGMIGQHDMMEMIKKTTRNLNVPYVIDPVMVATSGDPLIDESAMNFLRNELLPLASIMTPNIPEAEYLLDMKINSKEDMEIAAKGLVEKLGVKASLVTGGHLEGEAIDYLYDGKELYTFPANRIDTNNTHGTGCTLSAAITAYLSKGYTMLKAVEQAKKYVTLAIQHSLELGHGSGPTNHWAPRL